MQFYKSSNTVTSSPRKYSSVLIMFFVTILSYSLQITNSHAVTSTINSIAAGNWGDGSSWSTGVVPDGDDFVNINNPMNLNNNLSPAAGAVYTFYAASSGSGGLNMATGAVLDIRANVTLTGSGVNLNGGTIYVRSGYTLTLNDIATANSSTYVIVETGATLKILGNFLDNHGTMTIDGTLTVVGNYDGQAADATVTGNGDFTTGGYLKGINGSSVFGVVNPNCGGPNCNARNLCAAYTVSVAPTSSLICGTGATQVLTAAVSSASTYQWQIATVSGGTFVDIPSATNATYTAGYNLGIKAYYRVKATGTCIRYSNEAVVIPGGGSAAGAAAILPVNPSYCQNEIKTFTAVALGASEYVWSVPSGYTILSGAGTSSISVRIGSATGNITVIPRSGCGDGTAGSTTVTATALPANPGAITGPANVCQGATGQIYSIAAVSGAASYKWTIPSGASIVGASTGNSISVTFSSNAGNVSVTPVNSCGYSSSASSIQAVTISTVVPSNVGAISGATSVCKEAAAEAYSISAVTGATSYSVTLPSGATISSGSGTVSITASFTGASVGSGTLTFTATNGCGSKSANITLTITTGCAESWTGGTSIAWNTATNWSKGFVPLNITPVTIPSGTTYAPTVAATSTAAGITINSGATLTLASTGVLNVTGNIANSGTITSASGSTVAFTGTSAQTITGVPTLYNTTINNAAGVTITTGAANALTVKGTLALPSGAFTTNGNLSIDINTGGNIAYTSGDAGSVSGNVTVYRSVNSIGTHYISCPLGSVTANDLADDAQVFNATNGNTRLFQFDNTAYKWNGISSLSTVMSPSASFSMYFTGATSLDFTGTYSHAATYSYSAPNVATKFMFVSNPYPSTLDWDAASGWTKNGVNNAIYFWNPTTNSYSSYVGGSSTNGGTKYIPALNSFFVAYNGTTPSTANVAMDGRVRSTATQSLWRTAAEETVRLTLKNANASDEAVIRFNEDATNEFDGDLDAYKMMNGSYVPSIYTKFGATNYSINSISGPYAKDTIHVYTKIPADGDYVLSITSSDPSIEYVLVDKKLGTETIVTTRDYSFTALKTDSLNRFDLQMRQSTTTGVQNSNGTSNISILSSPNGFLVKSNLAGTGTIEILDVTGNRVQVLPNIALTNGNNFFTPEVAGGLYLIKVSINNTVSVGHASIIK